jgi:hypothetical protein
MASKKFVSCFAALLLGATLNAATVSIVNQTSPTGASIPFGTASSSTTVPQTTNQYNQSQKGAAASPIGKLPASKGAGGGARKPKLELNEPAQHVEEPTYTFPGLLAKIGNRWVGNDYLYDLHRNIGVVVEVITNEGREIPVDKEGLKEMVKEIFMHVELVPESLASENTPPLPFFHILIFVSPAENSNVAFVSGRLFEDALLARYGLDPIGTWQAITWEKQDLVITSPLQFSEQLKKSVANIAQTFADKVIFYAKIKSEAQSDAKLYYPKVIPEPPKTSKPGL